MPDQIKKDIPSASFVYRLVRRILRAVLYIFFQEIEVVGKENVPTKGPVIFVGRENEIHQFYQIKYINLNIQKEITQINSWME